MALDTLINLLVQRAANREPAVEDLDATKYSRPQRSPEELLKEAQEIASGHPRSAEAQKGVKTTNSAFLTNLMSLGMEPHGRSFALPQFNRIVMSPTDPDYADTYAHELGHIDQYKQGMPVKNNSGADTILRDLLQAKDVKASIVPEPYKSTDPYIAEMMQKYGMK